jgi:hypothetical protein
VPKHLPGNGLAKLGLPAKVAMDIEVFFLLLSGKIVENHEKTDGLDGIWLGGGMSVA